MLLLKNEIKEVFKTQGMPEGLTVSRTGKFVSISGKCGQPVLAITTVEVGGKLTAKERSILIDDYITPALKANKKAILEYIKLKKDTTVADSLESLKAKHHGLTASTKGYRGTDYINVKLNDGDGNASVELGVESQEFTISLNNIPCDYYKGVSKNLIKDAQVVLPLYLALLLKQNKETELLKVQEEFLTQKCGF